MVFVAIHISSGNYSPLRGRYENATPATGPLLNETASYFPKNFKMHNKTYFFSSSLQIIFLRNSSTLLCLKVHQKGIWSHRITIDTESSSQRFCFKYIQVDTPFGRCILFSRYSWSSAKNKGGSQRAILQAKRLRIGCLGLTPHTRKKHTFERTQFSLIFCISQEKGLHPYIIKSKHNFSNQSI